MKKYFLILIILFLITGCDLNIKSDIRHPDYNIQNIEFVPNDKEGEYKTIYNYPDGRKIISEFTNIFYENYEKNTGKLELENAIEKGYLTIDDLINELKIERFDILEDGKLYHNGNDSSVYIAICENENIILGSNAKIIEKCHNQ